MALKNIELVINARDKASSVFANLKATAVAAGVAIAAYFGIRTFSGAISGAADLQAKMSELQAVAGATAEQMAALEAAATDAGATTKFTAGESTDALTNLSRAGLGAEASIFALKPTLVLAQSANLELGRSAEIVTKTMAGFSLEADKAGRVADVLSKGANSANTNVEGLAQGLSYAAPTANALGLSLEFTVALLGKFADAGIDASRGGTALNAILAQFSDPASRFRKELADAGITTNNFEQALHELAAAGPAGERAILAVGTEAGPALRGLLNQGIGALDDLKAKLDGAAGSAQAAADVMQNNLNGSVLSLGSIWETVTNTLGKPVLPVLKDGVDQLVGALRSAVDSGTVAKFGDAIAKGFQAALTWGKAFLAQVDFDALSVTVSSAADRVGAAFVTLEGYAKNTGNGVALVWGVMSAGANTVLAVVYTIGEAFAGVASNVQAGISLILSGLAKISFGSISDSFKAAAESMEISAGATGAASEALASKAREAFIAVAEGAQTARDGWAGLTESTVESSTQAATSAKVFDTMAAKLETVGDTAQAAGQKTQAAMQGISDQAKVTDAEVSAAFERMGIKTKESLTQAAENAKRDFDLVKNSGQATADGIQAAFTQYAQAAIAANGGVASEALKSQAAMQGLKVASDGAGKAIVQAMNSGTSAAAGLTNGLQGAIEKVKEYVGWADRMKERNDGVKSTSLTDGQGFSADAKGNRTVAGTDLGTLTGIFNFLKGANLNDEQARSVAKEFANADGTVDYVGNSAQMKYGGKYSTMSQALLKAAESITFGTTGPQAGSAEIGRTVTLKLDTGKGAQETVKTDDAGAASIVRALKKAGLSAGR